MKLTYLDLCGFRGYRNPVHIYFAEGFTIIDGRNGVGKSTIFDAIEYALTGSISKYEEAKASGESVADYIWWTGEGPAPTDRYVEVGFRDSEGDIKVRRTQLSGPENAVLQNLELRLCEPALSPLEPIQRLCVTAIIRDEHITRLSLDLKEADRYALLREALGANDADEWITRGNRLVTLAKNRVVTSQSEVASVNAEVASGTKRLDEVRASLVEETVMSEVVDRLRQFTNSNIAPDQLAGPVRETIARTTNQISALQSLNVHWGSIEVHKQNLPALKEKLHLARKQYAVAEASILDFSILENTQSSSKLAEEAASIMNLVSIGRSIGAKEGHCPLCSHEQSQNEFENGIKAAEALAMRLNEDAALAAEREYRKDAAVKILELAKQTIEISEAEYKDVSIILINFESELEKLGLGKEATMEDILAHTQLLQNKLEIAQRDFRVLETLRFSSELEKVKQLEIDATSRLMKAQERFGKARKALSGAQALHDAARRAASETLDLRLERVLPLMSELFRRLRPHPVWNDIEYSIRGDVKRFLKLQVGEDLNPQFLFSSGQRRATGLAFLLSVNLSLAWSRWKTILLDDPVQHVDDFRTVHLAELMAQLVSNGRQIICSVEDEALADLLCRRLPVEPYGGKRVTLGPNTDGSLTTLVDRVLSPLEQNSMMKIPMQSAAG